MGTVTHVATPSLVAALTFDDGPHPEFTPRLLDILESHQVRGTFFMLGEYAQQYPELVRRVAQGGHAIGNHSWDHASFPFISRRERQEQIKACQQALTPHGQLLFRPPYGEQNIVSYLDPRWLGYKVIGWNVEVGDWWDQDAHRMTDLLVKRLKPGSIIILHDALRQHPSAKRRPLVTREPHVDREAMLEAVNRFLGQTANRYRFVTIPQLMQYGRPQRRYWYRVAQAAG